MPDCRLCHELDGEICRAHAEAKATLKRPIPPPPIGACMMPIVRSYLKLIEPKHQVLEIGCGTWSPIKDQSERVGAGYEAIDVQEQYYGENVVATRIENLAALSYENDRFDIVVGNQTMEHWAEHGCTMEWGLYQCFRVLKPGGTLLLNVPIYFHGTKDFLHGRLDRLKALFSRFSGDCVFESWGQDPAPLPRFYAHPRFWALENRSAYILDIRARKDKALPRNVSNRLGLQGKLGQLFHYSLEYNVYRLLKKSGLR